MANNVTAGQRIVEIRDIGSFAIDFVTSVGLPRMDINNNDLSDGVNLGPADGTASGGPYFHGLYLHVVDTYLWEMLVEKKDSGSARQFYPAVYTHDAVCQNPDVGWWQPLTYSPRAASATDRFFHFNATATHRFVVGQPNPRTMEQAFYWTQGDEWSRYNVFDCSVQAHDVWQDIGQDLTVNGPDDDNVPGYWSADEAGSTTARYTAIAFEGITDTTNGMPGETDTIAGMLRGNTTHPQGLLLVRSDDHNFDGTGTASNDHDLTWLWVDLDTGEAVGKLGALTLRSSDDISDAGGRAELWQTSTMDKRSGFAMSTVQFVPDVDSRYDRPKGELHFFFIDQASYTFTNRDVLEPDGSTWSITEGVIQYFQVVEFNPFNQDVGEERVHNRITAEGHFLVPYDPLIPGGAVSLTENASRHERVSANIYYHPPSRTYVNVQASYSDPSNEGTAQPDAGSHRIIRWARDNTDDAVSFPTPDAAVIENGASYIDVWVTNQLNEPVQNHTVYFQTLRQSTRAETFDGTAQGASAYVVAEAVIDEDGHLDVREGDDVDNGGTLLVETTDYTVNYGTGTLTPVGSWPTDDIYVRYRHRSSEVNPGFGTLTASSAVTDLEGKATAILLLDDNLDGELVGINVSTEAAF